MSGHVKPNPKTTGGSKMPTHTSSFITLPQAIGQTPLLLIKSLSHLLKQNIYLKAEFLNPGGSVKDRAALSMIQSAFDQGQIKSHNSTLYEGTAGNTGIGLAMLAAHYHLGCHIFMPNNQSQEKIDLIRAYGAEVTLVPPTGFSDPNHFYHQAKNKASQDSNGYWVNQFENPNNYLAHYNTTGPEIYSQCPLIDVFACSAGTGGTIGGVSSFLKGVSLSQSQSQSQNSQNSQMSPLHINHNPPSQLPSNQIKCYLIDPYGSGLYSWYHNQEFKSSGSSVTEGIGIMRLTENFKQAKLDGAIQVTDTETFSMLEFLAHNEGLFVGPSAALNLFGLSKLAIADEQKNKSYVTIGCDLGTRYQSKLFSQSWLEKNNLNNPPPLSKLLGLF